MVRMRLLKECVLAVKATDPETSLTTHAIRELVLTGKVSSIMVGRRRRLINLDSLFEYLETGITDKDTEFNDEIRIDGDLRSVRKVRAYR